MHLGRSLGRPPSSVPTGAAGGRLIAFGGRGAMQLRPPPPLMKR